MAIRGQGAVQALGCHIRQGAGQGLASRVAIPDLGRIDIEPVVQQVGGQQAALPVDDVGPRLRRHPPWAAAAAGP